MTRCAVGALGMMCMAVGAALAAETRPAETTAGDVVKAAEAATAAAVKEGDEERLTPERFFARLAVERELHEARCAAATTQGERVKAAEAWLEEANVADKLVQLHAAIDADKTTWMLAKCAVAEAQRAVARQKAVGEAATRAAETQMAGAADEEFQSMLAREQVERITPEFLLCKAAAALAVYEAKRDAAVNARERVAAARAWAADMLEAQRRAVERMEIDSNALMVAQMKYWALRAELEYQRVKAAAGGDPEATATRPAMEGATPQALVDAAAEAAECMKKEHTVVAGTPEQVLVEIAAVRNLYAAQVAAAQDRGARVKAAEAQYAALRDCGNGAAR